MGNYNKTLANRLKELRIERKLSQEQLGEIADLSLQTISNYETAGRRITKDKARRFAEIFNVDVEYLLDENVIYRRSEDKERAESDMILKDLEHDFSFVGNIVSDFAKLNHYKIECVLPSGNTISADEMLNCLDWSDLLIFKKNGYKEFSLTVDEAYRLGKILNDVFTSIIDHQYLRRKI